MPGSEWKIDYKIPSLQTWNKCKKHPDLKQKDRKKEKWDQALLTNFFSPPLNRERQKRKQLIVDNDSLM